MTDKTKQAFGRMAPWLKFLAILGFVGLGVLFIVGVVMMVLDLRAFYHWGRFLGAFYIVISVVMFFPVRWIFHWATLAKRCGQDGSDENLEALAVNLHRLVKFYGIMTIVLLAVYVVVVVTILGTHLLNRL